MAYTFEQLLAADPSNPSNIAQNGSITIFAPGDPTMAPLTITDPDGSPLPNPFTVNANGFGPAFAHATLDRVAWSGGGFTGFVTSYEGMKAEAVAARAAAETAAATAGADAAAVADAAIGDATAEATAAKTAAETAAANAASSATAAANSAALVGAPADSAIAAAINGSATATKTALSATYAGKGVETSKLDVAAAAATYSRAAGARPGNNVVFLGDSITARGGQDSIGWNGSGFPHYSAILSGRRINYVRNAGVPGNVTSQMLARFDTDVAAHNPNVVVILAGTNDVGQTLGLATPKANIPALVAKCHAIGAKPVLCTIPPNNGTLSPLNGSNSRDWKANIVALNTFIRRYAALNGIDVVDFYTLLTDPANGNWKAAYYNDGTHPNNAADFAMGKLVADTLGPLLPARPTGLPADAVDPNNFVLNPLFLAGSPVPTSWTNQGGVTGQTTSIVTGDTSIIGNWFRFDAAATTGTSQLYQQRTSNPAGQTVTPGNRYAFIGRVKSSALSAGQQVVAQIRFQGGVTTDFRAVDRLDQAMTNGGVFYVEGVAPAGSTSVMPSLQLWAGTGDVQFAQIGVYDLTAMGVL